MSIFKRKPKTVPVMKTDHPTFLERWLETTSSTSKQLMWLIIICSCVWITCSYVLAWFGREQIAEALSSNIVTVVLGSIIAYLTSKTVENLSKYNPKLGGTPVHVLKHMQETIEEKSDEEDLFDNVTDVVYDTDVNTAGPDEEVPEPETNEEVVG